MDQDRPQNDAPGWGATDPHLAAASPQGPAWAPLRVPRRSRRSTPTADGSRPRRPRPRRRLGRRRAAAPQAGRHRRLHRGGHRDRRDLRGPGLLRRGRRRRRDRHQRRRRDRVERPGPGRVHEAWGPELVRALHGGVGHPPQELRRPEALDSKDITYGAIRGMTDAIGDTEHTRFLTPDDLARQEQDLRGSFAGIGAVRWLAGYFGLLGPFRGRDHAPVSF